MNNNLNIFEYILIYISNQSKYKNECSMEHYVLG